VTYDTKHNEANGEGGRDGSDGNLSWNCGAEGPTDDPVIEARRRRQIKNLLAIELLSFGVPMLLMGDEVRRTQSGNNNAYCQDGPISWFDWSLVERNEDILRFTKRLIVGRRRLSTLIGVPRDVGLAELLRRSHIEWSGTRVGQPDWGPDSHTLAATVVGRRIRLHLIFNAYWEPLDFELPPSDPGSGGWRRIIDTTFESPDDFLDAADSPPLDDRSYRAGPRSVVLLVAGRNGSETNKEGTSPDESG
jgi:isoamylase